MPGWVLWFACYLEGYCRVLPATDSVFASESELRFFPFGTAAGGSFAVLRMRQVREEFEFGPDAGRAAADVVLQIQAWDQRGRPSAPRFGFSPARSQRLSVSTGATELQKVHGVVTMSWD